MSSTQQFVMEDYIVFGLTIAFSLAIGLYFAFTDRKKQTITEYLLANRKMKIFPVTLSLVVSFESSVLMLGVPAEIYMHGIMIVSVAIGVLVACFIASRIIIPVFHPLKLTSAFEYLELRYKSRGPRMFGTSIGIIYYILYLGIVLYAPAIALEGVTDFPMWASILLVASTSVIYTAVGGFKAVVWTDAFQFVVMMTGVLAVVIKGTLFVGGVNKVFEINNKHKRLYIEWDPNPTIRHSVFTLLVGYSFRYLDIFINQTTIQRISSVPRKSDAKKVMLIAGPVFFLTVVIVCMEGLTAFSYFNTVKCDPLLSEQVYDGNQVLPFMILKLFHELPGLSGLFIASLFSASLSTISSGLSSLSAQTVDDIVKPAFDVTERRATLIAKCSVFLYGGLTVAVSYLAANVDASLPQITTSLTSSVGSPLCGIFLYSIFFPWATKRGVFTGGICGMAIVFFLSTGQSFSPTIIKTPSLPPNPTDQCAVQGVNITLVNLTSTGLSFEELQTKYFRDKRSMSWLDQLFSLSYVWYGFVGVFTMMLVGTITSFLGKRPAKAELDTKLMLPICETLCPCLPLKIRQSFYFGVQFDKKTNESADFVEDEMKSLTTNKTDL